MKELKKGKRGIKRVNKEHLFTKVKWEKKGNRRGKDGKKGKWETNWGKGVNETESRKKGGIEGKFRGSKKKKMNKFFTLRFFFNCREMAVRANPAAPEFKYGLRYTIESSSEIS